MPTERTIADRTRQTPPIRSTDERGRLLPSIFPTTDEERRANVVVVRWDQTVRELEAMTDETDTPELWNEVLRNLGVDPETGRGLPTRRGVRIGGRINQYSGEPCHVQ